MIAELVHDPDLRDNGHDRVHDRRLEIARDLDDAGCRTRQPGRGEHHGCHTRCARRQGVRTRDRAECPAAHSGDAGGVCELRAARQTSAAAAHGERHARPGDGIATRVLEQHRRTCEQRSRHGRELPDARDGEKLRGWSGERDDAKTHGAAAESRGGRLERLAAGQPTQGHGRARVPGAIGHDDGVCHAATPGERPEVHWNPAHTQAVGGAG